MSSIVPQVSTVNASSSDKSYPYDNLNSHVSGYWRSEAGALTKEPQWLNFDLGKNYLLEKIRIISTERQACPMDVAVDYFGNDLRLIGRDINTFTFDAENDSFQKYQEFAITDAEHAVKYVRIRILNNWGADHVQLNAILFFGTESQKGVKAVPMAGPEDNDLAYVPQQWYVGDRVRYRWEPGSKWYEGRILHINDEDGNNGTTYLIKDDSGWVKDHITPRNTREPRYRRKPRKLKASCSEISLKPIVEALEEEDEVSEPASSGDESPLSDIEEKSEPPPTPTTVASNLSRRTLPPGDSPKSNPRSPQNPTRPLSRKKSPLSIDDPQKAPTKRTGASFAKLASPKSSKKNLGASGKSGSDRENVLVAKNFKMKRINGVYRIKQQREGGRPLFQKDKGLTIWWYPECKTWMISQKHLVGTDKSYAFVRDTCWHPLDIQKRWKTYNKLQKTWDADPGALVAAEDDDDVTLAALSGRNDDVSAPSPSGAAGTTSGKSSRARDDKAKEESGDYVPWKVVLSGFRVDKLNSVYLKDKKQTAGRHMFRSPVGKKKERLVLWWYNRRKFWMLSPQSLVGTDKSYACIQHVSMHPKDVAGIWQVFDTGVRKFTMDRGAKVSPGTADKVELSSFPEWSSLNGTYVEQPDWHADRPLFLSKRQHHNLVLFYNETQRQWSVVKEGNLEATPLAYCAESSTQHPKDIVKQEWFSGLKHKLPNGKLVAVT